MKTTRFQQILAEEPTEALERLASELRVDLSTVYRWRNGQRYPRKPTVVAALFRRYPELDFNALYGGHP